MNSNDSYTHEEFRLLDEFAGRAMGNMVEGDTDDKMVAKASYDTAAAMIAERRKRVPSANTFTPSPSPTGQNTFTPRPVAQPQPEQGELTEKAVRAWLCEAQSMVHEKDDSLNLVHDDEINLAVALMREGLRAKVEAECAWKNHETVCKERDEARAALAEAKPVLDAVVLAYPSNAACWSQSFNKTLQAYADRRREQAKGAS